MSDTGDDNVVHFPPPPPTDEPDDKKKRIANPLNLRRELQNNALTKGLVGFDEFAKQIILQRPIPRPGLKAPKKFEPRPWSDADNTALAEHLNSRGFRRVGETLIFSVVNLEARSNPFHPVRKYLDGLKWDGKERLSGFLIEFCGAVIAGESQDEKKNSTTYIKAVSRAFFISAVARIFEPGCKVDTMPIFEGLQGLLKSAMLRSLAVRDEWFTDSSPHDLSNKDARSHLAGKWIIEMGEVAQFKRSEIETVKLFLSCQIDTYRPPYGRSDISVPRQCVIVGTTNATVYLHDPTGNRRFWPVKVSAISLDDVRANVGQLWAEAVAAFMDKEQWWLTPEVEALASEEQEDRAELDPWHDQIAVIVAQYGVRFFSTAHVLTKLEVPQERRDRNHEMRVGNVLRRLGCERKRVRIGVNKKPKWVYFMPKPKG